jgi:hypothetical protein
MAPWEPQEDLLLLRAVRSHGTNWADIEALGVVPGRTARQMRARFATTLDPDIDHSPLNAEVSGLASFLTRVSMAYGFFRQTRARFATTLDPDIDHSPLNAEVRQLSSAYNVTWSHLLLLPMVVLSGQATWERGEGCLGLAWAWGVRQMRARFATTLDPDIDHSPLNAEVRRLGNVFGAIQSHTCFIHVFKVVASQARCSAADIEALGVVPGRTARQMRARFATTLDPDIDHSPLNAEVGQLQDVLRFLLSYMLPQVVWPCKPDAVQPTLRLLVWCLAVLRGR